MKTILQSVLWNGTSALAPLSQPLPPGLVLVPVRRPYRADQAGLIAGRSYGRRCERRVLAATSAANVSRRRRGLFT
ncbi:MAG: hypothetical protein KAH46_18070, partial [Mycobacterium sp.]|nr:hypothetical protein [Mycobacterium sp.]